ncbi:MAG: alginate lyase [Acidobacteria bacterium]|nr:MAG: alginate lyase [Acidobacteriota bacterium]RPJ59026.1 MAG: alginate lyase [Acidobacteriota bacterium]
MIKRLLSLLVLGAFTAPTFSLPQSPDSLIFFRVNEAEKLREQIRKSDPSIQALAQIIRRKARSSLRDGPWSVTFHRPEEMAIGRNDFFSEGPYWWPDPKNPTGPYIRRDGERNPNRFTANDEDLGNMSAAVFNLGVGAYFLDDADAARRAAEVVRVWFIDPTTRMNPNLEYGQAIRGINTGRGTGIIDTVPLIWTVQGLALLKASGRWSAEDAAALQAWFRQYLTWLTTSNKGLDEKGSGNNHATWWSAQVAAYSLFVGDMTNYDMTSRWFKETLLSNQMEPDGSCPREEARTRSLSYSAMNLNGFSLLCRMAEIRGQDLWHFKGPKGASVLVSIKYLFPFVKDPNQWKKQQITRFSPESVYFQALAGLATSKSEYVTHFESLSAKMNEPPLTAVRLILAASE